MNRVLCGFVMVVLFAPCALTQQVRYDVPKETPGWGDVVSKTLDPKAKPEKQETNLQKSITKLLTK